MADGFSKLPREAVVLVHGIGEQQPMNTLLGFEEHVAAEHETFGAPDDLRGRMDQRKLKVTWDQTSDPYLKTWDPSLHRSCESNTDFYELYWAYQFRDTKVGHVVSWLKPLVTRPRRSVRGERLLGPSAGWAVLLRLLVLLAMLLACFVGVRGAIDSDWSEVWFAAGVAVLCLLVSLSLGLLFLVRMMVLVGLAATVAFVSHRANQPADATGGVLTSLFGFFAIPAATAFVVGGLTKSLGDASRYLTNSPDNVQANEEIRRDAVDLLEGLHNATEPSGRYRYDRVIVVGHSLGSVIAYDAVRHLWARRHKGLNFPVEGSEDLWSKAVCDVETAGVDLAAMKTSDASYQTALNTYQDAQQDLYRLLRDVESTPTVGREPECRWIVSDLITLGSPLAYADLLLARNVEDLNKRCEDRMLATCPPAVQRSKSARLRPYRFAATGSRPATRLHHAAVFAPVRWTNLYFSHDLIGGPVQRSFGLGVRDVDLGGGRWFGWFLLSNPHSSYWKPPGGGLLQVIARRRDQERSARSLSILQALIQRPPSVYIRLDDVPTVDAVGALADLLRRRSGGHVPADVAEGLTLRPVETRVFVHVPVVPGKSRTKRVSVWVPSAGAPSGSFSLDGLLPAGRVGLAVSLYEPPAPEPNSGAEATEGDVD